MTCKSPQKVKKQISEPYFNSVVTNFPAREKQIKRIAALVGESDQYAFPCIFMYGPAATGKTAVVKSFLQDLNLQHAFINCIEAYTPRLLMESILNQISEVIPGPDNDFEGYATCANTCDLVRLLKKIVVEKELEDETIYLVFDNCERLRDMPPSLLAALMRLQEITELNLCTILISEIIWEKFRNGFCFYEPCKISFPQYTKEETVSILERECPKECSLECYRHYINLVLSVFLVVTRNLLELRYLAVTNFSKYYEPVESGEATEKDIRKLWRNIEPHLKKSLNTVYLRENASESNNAKETQTYELRANVELPFYSKFLLIAAYIASYNPPASDKRFFIKNTGKVYKRKSGHKKSAPANQHQKGPKAFPLNRLLSIFYVIVEEKVTPGVALMSQISNLVTLKLLEVKTGAEHPLSSPKYKCLVNLDFIRSIARYEKFNILPLEIYKLLREIWMTTLSKYNLF